MSDWTSYNGKYMLEFSDYSSVESVNAFCITAKNKLTDSISYILTVLPTRKDALTFMLNLIIGLYTIERVKQIEYDYRESVPVAVERRPVNV